MNINNHSLGIGCIRNTTKNKLNINVNNIIILLFIPILSSFIYYYILLFF